MTAPRLEACYFRPRLPDPDAPWPRLAAVLEASARLHCPGWTIHVREVLAPFPRSGVRAASYLANTHKLEAWVAAVDGAADGDRLVLLDADAMVTNPLDAIWDQPFDVAYTARSECRVPLNAGVVFVRVSPAARRFMGLWRDDNAEMLRSFEAFAPWRSRYVGVNQAALGKVLETRGAEHGAVVVAVPCEVWNCENTAWASFDPASTRIVHVKDQLRQAVLDRGPVPPGAGAAVAQWRRFDQMAREAPPCRNSNSRRGLVTPPPTKKPKLDSAVTVKLSPALHDAACRLALAEYDGNLSGMIRALIKAAVTMQASAR